MHLTLFFTFFLHTHTTDVGLSLRHMEKNSQPKFLYVLSSVSHSSSSVLNSSELLHCSLSFTFCFVLFRHFFHETLTYGVLVRERLRNTIRSLNFHFRISSTIHILLSPSICSKHQGWDWDVNYERF
jgi:hypothetical protein